MRDEHPYNPLEKRNIGNSVADALLSRQIEQLPLPVSFIGAGVYAIYYKGPFEHYAPIAERNRERCVLPIYVGKAVSPGSRKGGALEVTDKPVLFGRINEHAESIMLSSNLNVADFYAQYLVVDDIWIPFGETMLIQRFTPLWNHVLDGFGNHDPGKGRYEQKISSWDTVHPGRVWATRLQPNKPLDFWLEAIEKYMSKLGPILPDIQP